MVDILRVTAISVLTAGLWCFLLLTSEWHSLVPNVKVLNQVRLVNCYSAHEAAWSQTAGPWIGPCLFNSKGGVSVLCWQVDFLCLQRCWIFHWLLSARQWWVKSLSAVIVLNPNAEPDLWAISARRRTLAAIRNAWEKKSGGKKMSTLTVIIISLLHARFHRHPECRQHVCNPIYIWYPSLAVSRCCHFHGNKET